MKIKGRLCSFESHCITINGFYDPVAAVKILFLQSVKNVAVFIAAKGCRVLSEFVRFYDRVEPLRGSFAFQKPGRERRATPFKCPLSLTPKNINKALKI